MDSKASPATTAFIVRDCGNLGETDGDGFACPHQPAAAFGHWKECQPASLSQTKQSMSIIIGMMSMVMVSDGHHHRRRR